MPAFDFGGHRKLLKPLVYTSAVHIKELQKSDLIFCKQKVLLSVTPTSNALLHPMCEVFGTQILIFLNFCIGLEVKILLLLKHTWASLEFSQQLLRDD